MIERKISNSLEALANLLYLIRKTVASDPKAAASYVGLADNELMRLTQLLRDNASRLDS